MLVVGEEASSIIRRKEAPALNVWGKKGKWAILNKGERRVEWKEV